MNKPHFLVIDFEFNSTHHRLYQEAKALGYVADFFLYQQLVHQQTPVPKLPVTNNTIGILSRPFVANNVEQQFHGTYEMIIKEYQFAHLLNNGLNNNRFLAYEDKLFQAYAYQKIGVPYAKCVGMSNEEILEYPAVAKKRISSHGRSNFLLKNKRQLKFFLKSVDSSLYFFQEYFELKGDYRVLVFQNKVLAVIEREVHLRQNNRLAVKVIGEATLPKRILKDCLKVSKFMHCEFSGVDVGIEANGEHFIIEHNGRPQITGAERVLKRNLAREAIEQLVAGVS